MFSKHVFNHDGRGTCTGTRIFEKDATDRTTTRLKQIARQGHTDLEALHTESGTWKDAISSGRDFILKDTCVHRIVHAIMTP